MREKGTSVNGSAIRCCRVISCIMYRVRLFESIEYCRRCCIDGHIRSIGFPCPLLIGIKGIKILGSESEKQKYLVPAAAGDMIFFYVLTEPKIGSDARHIETKTKLSGGGTSYVVSGVKIYITNADYAKGLRVFAPLDPQKPGFMGAYIVETAGGRDGEQRYAKDGFEEQFYRNDPFRHCPCSRRELTGRLI